MATHTNFLVWDTPARIVHVEVHLVGPRPTDYLRTKLQQLLPEHPELSLIHITDHTELGEIRAWLRKRDETDLRSLTVSRELVRDCIRTGDDSELMRALETEIRQKSG